MEKQFSENPRTRSSWIKIEKTLLKTKKFDSFVQDELFEKARGEILDEVVNLSLIPSQQWYENIELFLLFEIFSFREDNLSRYLWNSMSNFIFDDVFTTAAQAESTGQR